MPVRQVGDVAAASSLLSDTLGPVVVVPVYNAADDVRACLSSLFAHTDPRHGILVIDDASPDPAAVEAVLEVSTDVPHTVVHLLHPVNTGFVGSCNDAFAACAGHDVVLVNSDVVVAAEWLERMTRAAASSNTVATVSTLTNHGTIVSVPNRNAPGPMPEGLTVDDAAQRVAAAAKQVHPALPTGIGHCLLITRSALDAVGGFDPVFAPGYGEEVDFCQRASGRGFIHVLADDVFVYHRGGSSFGLSPEKAALQAAHEDIINERYPNYAEAVRWAHDSTRSALASALSIARRALVGTRVAVDGYCLAHNLMGTQRTVLETAVALSRRRDVAETHLFVSEEVPAYALSAAADNPRLVLRPTKGYVKVKDHFDVVVRPYQVDHVGHLAWMRSIAAVAVVTQLDLIAYHNPAYFPTPEAWRAYREVTEFAFDTIDGVAFISEHSRQEALREGLLNRAHQHAVTYCGLDHRSGIVDAVMPAAAPDLRPGFLLVLGASYLHKNRPFALELLRLLSERGYDNDLVLAGATPPYGNTLAEEDGWLASHPHLSGRVLRIGSTDEAEKAWLLQNAGLVLYPTITEGFGLVPFEAAAAGTPTLTTRQGSLDEVLPSDVECAVSLVPADNVGLAERMLHDPAFRAAQVAALQRGASGFTWESSAETLVDLMLRTLDTPAGRRSFGVPSPALRRRRHLERAVRLARSQRWIHRVLIGDGTLRQRAVRRTANWLRRRA